MHPMHMSSMHTTEIEAVSLNFGLRHRQIDVSKKIIASFTSIPTLKRALGSFVDDVREPERDGPFLCAGARFLFLVASVFAVIRLCHLVLVRDEELAAADRYVAHRLARLDSLLLGLVVGEKLLVAPHVLVLGLLVLEFLVTLHPLLVEVNDLLAVSLHVGVVWEPDSLAIIRVRVA